jgi:acetyl esterase/lipase
MTRSDSAFASAAAVIAIHRVLAGYEMMRQAWATGACALVLSGIGCAVIAPHSKVEENAPASAAVDHDAPWKPAAGLAQEPIWPENFRIQRPETSDAEKKVRGEGLVGGLPWTFVTNVSRPTMTVYPPRGHDTHAALLVFPGGGYYGVAIDLEGSEICDWITRDGLTCILLKYRGPQDWHKGGRHQAPAVQLALQDAQRAMGLVRQRSARYHIDPERVGVIGFSAGGHLVAAISNADKRTYEAVDAADSLPSRPNFAIALYPGHLWSGKNLELYSWNAISRNAPPTLLVQSVDDPVDDVRNSIAYAMALRAAGVPVEMHFYAEGGHAFGLRPTASPITTQWTQLAETWLHTIKIL